ncbi:MAG TPA: HlyD family secretion protein [Dissulfurispiraceae bacterium]|nr:HlyD family secretion protein [Dissulfurispiraceae bacterium]
MTESNNSNGKRKKIGLIVFGVTVVACIAAVIFYLVYKSTHITTDDAFVEGPIHTIAPKVSGTIQAVYVQDNQMVKAGDPLVELDVADYAAKTSENSAAVAAERGKLAELQARIASRRANVVLQQANLRQAGMDLERAEALQKEEFIPKERYDRAKTNYDIAQQQVHVATEELRQAEYGGGAQGASIREKEAKLRKAELDQSYTKIAAPADGMVTKKNVEVGNQVQPGQPLMAIVPVSGVWIVANYKETQLEKIRLGQSVEISIDSYPGKKFSGKVESIMAGTGSAFSLFPPQNATGNYVKIVQRVPIKIILDQDTDPQHILRVGMSVIPTVIVK